MIAQSVPHIYISALPFAPHESLIRKRYVTLFPNTLHMDGPLTDKWSSLRKVIPHPRKLSCTVFSPDGNVLASGSYNGTLHLWDSETGSLIAGPLKGHTASVRCLAFSMDGQRVVSGSSDKTLIIWDSLTGDVVAGPL